MRFRVTPRASYFADNMQHHYADGYGIYCEQCAAPAVLRSYAEFGEACEVARKMNASDDAKRHPVTVVPMVGNLIIPDPDNSVVVWQPNVTGQATKTAMHKDDFAIMYDRIEE